MNYQSYYSSQFVDPQGHFWVFSYNIVTWGTIELSSYAGSVVSSSRDVLRIDLDEFEVVVHPHYRVLVFLIKLGRLIELFKSFCKRGKS
jgi:hypothetical protein